MRRSKRSARRRRTAPGAFSPYARASAGLRALAVFTGVAFGLAAAAFARPAKAQGVRLDTASGVASEGVRELSAALRADQAAHLRRVGVWGAANAAGGLLLLALSDGEANPGRRGFAMQTAAWGAINTGIAAVGLLRGPGETTDVWADAHASENGYADVLLVNLGLNVGYAAVGGTLIAAASQGVPNPDAWRGHGAALIVQGAGLFVLDGIAYLASRRRMDGLVGRVERVAIAPSSEGVRVTARF